MAGRAGHKPQEKRSLNPKAPTANNRFSFRVVTTTAAFQSWPLVTELAKEELISGLQEMRRGGLLSIDREKLELRMKRYSGVLVGRYAMRRMLSAGSTRRIGSRCGSNSGGFAASG